MGDLPIADARTEVRHYRMLAAVSKTSADFSEALYALLDVPRFDDSDRIRVSDIACSMSLEHWNATRTLLSLGLLPSGVVILRAQFEALVRSIWALYAAPEEKLAKLAKELNVENEQAAKNLPLMAEMMEQLESKAPPQAYDALVRFKDSSWKALNSYVHAGLHPLRRHEEGYPEEFVVGVLRLANGLAVVAGMQIAVLSGQQPLVRRVLDLSLKHQLCMPPLQ